MIKTRLSCFMFSSRTMLIISIVVGPSELLVHVESNPSSWGFPNTRQKGKLQDQQRHLVPDCFRQLQLNFRTNVRGFDTSKRNFPNRFPCYKKNMQNMFPVKKGLNWYKIRHFFIKKHYPFFIYGRKM